MSLGSGGDRERSRRGVALALSGSVGLDGDRDHIGRVRSQRRCPKAWNREMPRRAALRLAAVTSNNSAALLRDYERTICADV